MRFLKRSRIIFKIFCFDEIEIEKGRSVELDSIVRQTAPAKRIIEL